METQENNKNQCEESEKCKTGAEEKEDTAEKTQNQNANSNSNSISDKLLEKEKTEKSEKVEKLEKSEPSENPKKISFTP